MIFYILKSILCSALLLSAYYLLLEKEKNHQFKRWYLLITLPLVFIIPLISIELEQSQLIAQVSKLQEHFTLETPLLADQPQPVSTEINEATFHIDWLTWILLAYGIVTAVLLFRMCKNFLAILSDVKDKTVTSYREATLVLHNSHVVPFSFLNYIFISRQDFDNKQILLHELTHIRQRHSLDILLVEFIHALMWFNPILFFYKKAIRLNHEFLADDVVLRNYPTADYQNILFQKASLRSNLSLASSFNYSATKKRFIMMTKMENENRASFRITLACLVTLSAVILFTEKVYGQNESIPTVVSHSKIDSDSLNVSKLDSLIHQVIKFRTNKNGTKAVHLNMAGVTKEQKKEAWVIYSSLTDEQKSKYSDELKLAIKLAFTSAPPLKKNPPTAEELAQLADPKIYGIWLDGKRVPNAALAKYKPSDIASVWKSPLMKNAAHYGQYKFHTDVMTHAYYDTTYLKNLE